MVKLRSTLLAAMSMALLATALAPSAQAAPMCFGKRATIVGSENDDDIVGTAGNDVIVAGGGNDEVEGLAGHDRICMGAGGDPEPESGDLTPEFAIGGRGNDLIDAGDGYDNVYGGPGDDQLWAGAPGVNNTEDHLAGGAGNDVLRSAEDGASLYGGDGADLLIGGPGDDTGSGGQGNDRIRLKGGNDRVLILIMRAESRRVGEGSDRVFAGEGTDVFAISGPRRAIWVNLSTGIARGEHPYGRHELASVENVDVNPSSCDPCSIVGNSGDNVIEAANLIRGGAGNDTLTGSGTGAADKIIGGSGNDTLAGQTENDELIGGDGDDHLDGGDGLADIAWGGPGSDTCVNSEEVHDCEMFGP